MMQAIIAKPYDGIGKLAWQGSCRAMVCGICVPGKHIEGHILSISVFEMVLLEPRLAYYCPAVGFLCLLVIQRA